MSQEEKFKIHRVKSKVKLNKIGGSDPASVKANYLYLYSGDKAEIASEHYMDKANCSLSSAGKP